MNIQKKSIDFFGNACYAYCLAYIFRYVAGLEEWVDWCEMTKEVLEGVSQHYIDEDGFVSKPVDFVNYTFFYNVKKYTDVKKVKITDLSELPNGIYAVQYVFGTTSHFVVANKKGVVFDPWEDSNTVKYGKPCSYRLFI